jgi:hypothetical protein
MIRTFTYRGQPVVIDDSLSLPVEFRTQKPTSERDEGDHDHGHHESATGRGSHDHADHDHSDHDHSEQDHGGHHPGKPHPHPGGEAKPGPKHPEHPHSAHGDIQIGIGRRTVMAYRVPSGYFFATHELPFVQFTNIDDLAKAVIDHMQLGTHHGSPKESE